MLVSTRQTALEVKHHLHDYHMTVVQLQTDRHHSFSCLADCWEGDMIYKSGDTWDCSDGCNTWSVISFNLYISSLILHSSYHYSLCIQSSNHFFAQYLQFLQ